MRQPDENDPELRDLVRRYVVPGRRYLKLGGGLLRRDATEREAFLRELGRDAAAITPGELTVLLEGGWRERRTAAWLIAVAGRAGFRERLGELLLASEVCCAGSAYTLALAVLGTPADADLLVDYLDRYLRRPDLFYDQSAALGALLHLDTELGADRAARFLAPGGLWQQWIGGPPRKEHFSTPERYREAVGRLRGLVAESARHCAVREG
ncbi:DUF6000 family protein [Kitasatospora phosalacinea]|uniref:Uncharacterized protein n=1 Tax=Kitasatospora phosalacinea TaxID=2065 RepID=A0A9W6PBW8_9ACTN|nr:DUF6000 family protein [Kitasatospora phosalacinea]GLW52127.1 hypothetical protein Kpho01_01380 [Kitasatospora phosalacinea]